MALSLSPADTQFLEDNLPVGWLEDAARHFAGNVSRSAISRHKLGVVKRPDPDVIKYLFEVAKKNQEKIQAARVQMSAAHSANA